MTGGLDLSHAPRLREFLWRLPASTADICEEMDVSDSTVEGYRERLAEHHDVELEYSRSENVWRIDSAPEAIAKSEPSDTADTDTDADDDNPDLPDLDGVEQGDDPDPEDLTDREEFVAKELQTGATVDDLADELNERPSVVTQHLRDLKRSGWQVYVDESAGHVAIEGDTLLRSSEHTGTRTRKANRWWEMRHNELVREFEGLSTPSADLSATDGAEDWITHMTDLHAGDKVRQDDGTVVYETAEIPAIIEYITRQSLSLADKHNSTYDAAHLLWGGDFVTNEGIYEGQFEDLDAWLDEQHDTLVAPLMAQLKAFSREFPVVNVVCMVGNHGQHRANGTSRQANADLILYKHIRNVVAQLQQHADMLHNVSFNIGDAKPYRNFAMRGGELKGHLRHGQNRRPQAETSAREKEWTKTLLDHEFDVAYMGHHHVGGVIPWDGPPIIASPSPKPAGEFVERIGGRLPSNHQGVATAHGVSDDGVTSVFPIDTRRYDGP